MDAPKQIRVTAKLEELNHLQASILGIAKSLPMSERQCTRLRLLVEELFVNVCMHGQNASYVTWTLQCTKVDQSEQGASLHCTVADDGLPFNPLAGFDEHAQSFANHPNSMPIPTVEEREFGGVGLHILQNFANKMSYVHAQGENQLSFEIFLTE